jgi:hypothetical protein
MCAVLMLAGLGAHRLAVVHRPAEVAAHHRHIREVAASIGPGEIHGWIGQDNAIPLQTMRVLDPNVIISRRYVNVESGTVAGFLLVHCSDAHDMAGHFPLRCYPADGWERRGARPREWRVGDLVVQGMEYQFSRRERFVQQAESNIVVCNFLLRPGQLLPDMDAMTASIVGAGGQSSGAGQVQVYFDASVPQENRDQAVVALVGGYRPLIDAMLASATESHKQ